MLLELEEVTRQRIASSDIRAQLTIRLLSETLAVSGGGKGRSDDQGKVRPGHAIVPMPWRLHRKGLLCISPERKTEGRRACLSAPPSSRILEGIETIEEMTRRYVPQVEAVAPTGPLGGGLVQWRPCRARTRGSPRGRGRTVEKIALIDTLSLNARLSCADRAHGFLGRPHHAGRPWPQASPQRHAYGVGPCQSHPAVRSRHSLAGDEDRAQRIDARLDSSRQTTYYRAMSKYLPSRIRAEIICLLRRSAPRRRHMTPRPGPPRAACAERSSARAAQYLRQHVCRRASPEAEPGAHGAASRSGDAHEVNGASPSAFLLAEQTVSSRRGSAWSGDLGKQSIAGANSVPLTSG